MTSRQELIFLLERKTKRDGREKLLSLSQLTEKGGEIPEIIIENYR
jgi:hypothetical protein